MAHSRDGDWGSGVQSDTTFLRNKTRCLDEPWKTQILYFGGVLDLRNPRRDQLAEMFDEDCCSEPEYERRDIVGDWRNVSKQLAARFIQVSFALAPHPQYNPSRLITVTSPILNVSISSIGL